MTDECYVCPPTILWAAVERTLKPSTSMRMKVISWKRLSIIFLKKKLKTAAEVQAELK
jgi:hypothetical protein